MNERRKIYMTKDKVWAHVIVDLGIEFNSMTKVMFHGFKTFKRLTTRNICKYKGIFYVDMIVFHYCMKKMLREENF